MKRYLQSAAIALAIGLFPPLFTVAALAQDKVMPLVKFDDVPIRDAIKNIARQAGINYILDPRVPGTDPGGKPWITETWTNATAKTAMASLLAQYKLEMVYSPSTTITRIAPVALAVKPVPAGAVNTNDTMTMPLISMEEVPLRDAIINLARQGQLKITFDSSLSAPAFDLNQSVSLRWSHVTIPQALAALLDNYGLVLNEDPGGASARISLKPKD